MQGNLQQSKSSYDMITRLTSLSGLDHAYLTSSGAMAAENALKLAFHSRQPATRVLAFEHCFMGRTMTLAHITDKPSYRDGLPQTIQCHYVPFYDEMDHTGSIQRAVKVLSDHLATYPNEFAVMCMELIQGENGYFVGHPDFFTAIITVLKAHNVLVFVDEIQTFGRYYHDLTEHIWAGLPVNIVLNVEDFVGQKGKSDVVEILLPEKQFNNLIALSVINQRKSLALGKDTPHNVGQILEEISESPEFENKLNIAKEWLLEAANILNKDKNAKTLNSNNYNFVIDLLWKTALFIESGQLAVAENELRRAQEDLREALSQGNEGTEIDDMVSNLDTALKKYLEELENPMDIDAPQLSESDNPGDRGGENGAQANDKENLEEKLEEIADLAASGSLDEAQEQLENMQDMTEAMDRDALGEALGEQEGAETPMAMQQISEMMQEQEALMEDSFEQSLNSAQADQKTPGSGPVNAGKEQEMLRKQLEDVMHEISESDNPMPEELGRAERAMKQAERELQRGRPDRAQTAQGRAIEELKKAAEKIDKMHSGDGPSQMAGDSGNNNSRDQRDPLGRVPPGQGTSPGGDIGLPSQQNVTKAKEIVKELYKKAESSQEGSVERKYVDSLLDWY